MIRSIFSPKLTVLAITSALCAFSLPALHAQSAPSTKLDMKQVSVDNGHLVFSVPSDFHRMTADQIAIKFPRSRPPKIVYANKAENISVAVTFTAKLPSLATAKSVFDKVLPQGVPGLHWIKDSYSTINHITWIDLEFITPALDTTIHNNALFTSLSDKGVGINLNTTTKMYSTAAPIFQAVKNSLSIHLDDTKRGSTTTPATSL